MLIKETHSSSCECTAEMISYMYDEASMAERDQFETHLLECVDCSDEFAELSNSRFSVFEWQKLEFKPLATPTFVVPFEKAVTAAKPGRRENIFSAISSLLAFNWRIAAAVGGLIVFVGLGLLISSKYLGQGTIQTANEQPGSEIRVPLPSAVPDATTDDLRNDVVSIDKPADGRSQVPKAIKISTDGRRQRHNVVSRVTDPKPLVYQAVTTPKKRDRKPPTLNSEGDDDDDSSLRLTDLFDSIGSRR